MIVARLHRFVTRSVVATITRAAIAILTVSTAGVSSASAQNPPPAPPPRGAPADGPVVARLVAEPNRLFMKAGETAALKITAYDARGAVIADVQLFVQGGPRQAPRNGSSGPGSPPPRPSTTSAGTTNPPPVNKSPRSPRARS